jgi:hypothetical protein
MFPAVLPDGGSNPRTYDFDDQVIRVVKWQPSGHGLTSTCSELAASRIGLLYDAPVIRGTVVWIPPEQIPAEAATTGCLHVGFTYLSGQNFHASDYPKIKNAHALPAAGVQLAWLRIGDQESHNQILWNTERLLPDRTSRQTNHFILVDQAALFGRHDWSDGDLGEVDAPYSLPGHLVNQLTMDQIEPTLAVIEALSDDDIFECFSDWPDLWGLASELPEKAARYLRDRRHNLADILKANWP